jgi:hypothetical protein
MQKYHGHTLDYWKDNAEEDYIKTPISVLKYITCLEEHIEQCNIGDVVNRRELLSAFINEVKEEFKEENLDYLDFIADRVLSK